MIRRITEIEVDIRDENEVVRIPEERRRSGLLGKLLPKYTEQTVRVVYLRTRNMFWRMSHQEWEEIKERSEEQPAWWGTGDLNRRYWLYKDHWYWDDEQAKLEDVQALIIARHQRKQREIERAKASIAVDGETKNKRRTAIPDSLKIKVWQRDSGVCVKCGTCEELEFDHIIPLSRGGANTLRNLQLLCAACNREKGDALA